MFRVPFVAATLGEHRPHIGEFACQHRFQDLPEKEHRLAAMQRLEGFFLQLQCATKGWIFLDATKTRVAYRLHGSPPNARQ